MEHNDEQVLNSINTGIFDSLPLGISIVNADLGIIYQNKSVDGWFPFLEAEPFLYLLKFAAAGKAMDFIPQHELPYIQKTVFEEKRPYEYSCEFSHRHRSYHFKFTLSPLLDEDGKACAMMEVVENLSEQHELNQALVQSKRFENVGRLASGIAHDFNNILQVIIGHCEIMQTLIKDSERLQRSLDVILTSGKKASSLTRQLLIFSRKQESDYKAFDLKETVGNLQQILSRMVGEDISIELNCERNSWCINADESQIEQIFLNLTVNGRDAMPLGGKLSITLCDCILSETDCSKLNLTKPGKYVMIRFADTGTGIESDKLEYIFDPFFTTKGGGKGTGLGLSTVYSVVRQHHGIITVHSEVNVGTIFEIYLPAADMEKAIKIEEASHDSEATFTDSILVVEDDLMVSDLATQVLSIHGYMVETAKDIREAIEKTSKVKYDLYLVDIVLPDGSGVDLIEYIKERDANARFLLSSGYTEDKPQIKRAIDNGYDFLHKPYTISTLLNTCREVLDNKKTGV